MLLNESAEESFERLLMKGAKGGVQKDKEYAKGKEGKTVEDKES